MRELTAKQKKLIRQFVKENPKVSSVQDLIEADPDFYEKLEKINDTEVLYTNVDRFIWDIKFE
jgi:hypothetical protein